MVIFKLHRFCCYGAVSQILYGMGVKFKDIFQRVFSTLMIIISTSVCILPISVVSKVKALEGKTVKTKK